MGTHNKQQPPESRYLIHFRVAGDTVDKSRARQILAGLAPAMKDISSGKYQLAYSSHDTGTFGILIKTSSTIKEIGDTIDRIPGDTLQSSLILKDDQYMILRMDYGGKFQGFGTAMKWLQHN